MANPEDLGRYRLKRLLGRGALGEVWEASDREQHGNRVAVKIMHAADDELAIARSQFAREGRLAALIRSPHVATVQDAGEAAGTSFLVMDMVEGTPLRKLIDDPATTCVEKLRWIYEVAQGLAAMHRGGVVHRDLKPENVLVRKDRSACVVDLGIAKWIKFDLGADRDPDDHIESPIEAPPIDANYVPPETAEQNLYDELGDQYAWGVVAYEALTGVVPDEGSPSLAERDDVPRAIGKAIDRARSARREDRFPGMEAVLDELAESPAPPAAAPPSARGAAAAPPGAAPDASIPVEGAPAPAPSGRGLPAVAAFGLVLAAIVVVGLILALC